MQPCATPVTQLGKYGRLGQVDHLHMGFHRLQITICRRNNSVDNLVASLTRKRSQVRVLFRPQIKKRTSRHPYTRELVD